REAGLRPGAVRQRESAQPADRVLAQSVEAGSQVAPGTDVGLTIAIAFVEPAPPPPDPEPVPEPVIDTTAQPAPVPATPVPAEPDSLLVPRVIGMTLAEARAVLADAGFAARADSGAAADAPVRTQAPEAGMRAARGAEIGLGFGGNGAAWTWAAAAGLVVLLAGGKAMSGRAAARVAEKAVESGPAHAHVIEVRVRPGSRPEFAVEGNPLRGVDVGMRVRPGVPEPVLVASGELIAREYR
ncbi:MAG TPA: PASTA domain-containing protein, partial [Longimicrobium sp.]|nr:PASTA domain-containing protein [Longimicrobium sp.]